VRNVFSCLVVALLSGALLAGCGGGGNTTSSSGASGTGTGLPGGRTLTGVSKGTGVTHALSAQQQVEACKHVLAATATLSASAKAKLEKTCEKAGASTASQREIVHEVCAALASRVPPGAARERALAVCRRAP
jgi:hypothetical protein